MTQGIGFGVSIGYNQKNAKQHIDPNGRPDSGAAKSCRIPGVR